MVWYWVSQGVGLKIGGTSRENSKTQSALNFLQSGPRNLQNLNFQDGPRSGGLWTFKPTRRYAMWQIPSDTKLLLTKNYSKIIIFEKLRISYVIPWKSPSFRRILRVLNRHKITKNNSQRVIFVTISCQRVISTNFLHVANMYFL